MLLGFLSWGLLDCIKYIIELVIVFFCFNKVIFVR